MRRWFLVLALIFCCVGSALAQPVSEEEKKEGFVPIFNGKDFAGWRFTGGKKEIDQPPKNWSVAAGMIRLTGGGSPHLASEWDYEDFDVRMQWKAHKNNYNSGYFIRSGRNVGSNQINLAQKAAGNLMGTKGGPAVPELQLPPGEWNEWRVLAVGDKLTFWSNGKKAWEVIGFKPARGYLGLQAEGAAIDFKNLRIWELGYEPVTFAGLAGDATFEEIKLVANGAKLVTKDKYGSCVLRLEYKLGETAKAQLFLRDKVGMVDLNGEIVGKASRPAGHWNYLEVRVSKDQAKLSLNGTTLTEMIDLGEGVASPLRLQVDGPAEVRNVRIKREK